MAGKAMSMLPKAVSLPALAGTVFGYGTSQAGDEKEGNVPPEATQKMPAQLRLENVMKDYETLQRRYDEAVKHRDLMLRGDPALKIPPGQGQKTRAAEQAVQDINEQLKGYTGKDGLLAQAQHDAQAEH